MGPGGVLALRLFSAGGTPVAGFASGYARGGATAVGLSILDVDGDGADEVLVAADGLGGARQLDVLRGLAGSAGTGVDLPDLLAATVPLAGTNVV